MSALMPREAVTLLYRRYIKAAHNVSNATIRIILLEQIRRGFVRNRFLVSPESQKELIDQAHKDLLILEDDRLSRTLFINNLGQVSCIDWENKRVKYEFSPKTYNWTWAYFIVFMGIIVTLLINLQELETAKPDIAEMVQIMQNRLSASSPEELEMKQRKQIRRGIDERARRDELEKRILATFYNAPQVDVMSMLISDKDNANTMAKT